MTHEGYADPVTKNGPGFHSNVPVSELTERVTRAIEASDVSSAPPIAETADRVMHGTRPTPTEPKRAQGLRSPDVDLGKSTDCVGRGRDKHGRTPRTVETQESTALEKSTKIFSLQPTHQSDAGSEATLTGCARAHPLTKRKIPQTILLESPRGLGAPIGFINPGSLKDRLPRPSLAQKNNI